ncbi:MAG TPA: aspartate kinase [Clostridia bacterium]|nr:aspartate kinase [Clostridia bacterium]
MENIIVQKYGGSSLETIDKVKNVAKRIIETKLLGNSMIVVVSAMGKTTDNLIDMACEICAEPAPREMDMLLSTGEQVSMSLLAMAIQCKGHSAISLTGSQCGILVYSGYNNARIENIDTKRLKNELSKDNIVIVAGFQGENCDGDIVTLGRGGSDTTAVALAAAVGAKKCEIYTDVDGIYTTDPRIVPRARLLKYISYDEMLELAKLGAKVLHPRAVEIARNFNVPLAVRSSLNNSEGTNVKGAVDMEKAIVRGITLDKDIAKISILEVPDRPGIAYNIFSKICEANIGIDMIIQNVHRNAVNDISFSVKSQDLKNALHITKDICKEINAKEVISDDTVVKLSIVGTGIMGDPSVITLFFETLYNLGINLEMISTSEIKISCIIKDGKAEEAVNELHSKFKLDA